MPFTVKVEIDFGNGADITAIIACMSRLCKREGGAIQILTYAPFVLDEESEEPEQNVNPN